MVTYVTEKSKGVVYQQTYQHLKQIALIITEISGSINVETPSCERGSKMERAKRLELSTATLARWCSTN